MNTECIEDRATEAATEPLSIATTIQPPHRNKDDQDNEIRYIKWLTIIPNGDIIIYTDGLRLQDGSVGAGWVRFIKPSEGIQEQHRYSCHLGKEIEVYNAELHAVEEALLDAMTMAGAPTTIFLCIDSQAAIESLADNVTNSEPCRKATQHTTKLLEIGMKTETIWTPSHCNIYGNEVADSLAKTGAENQAQKCLGTFA
jgi:ribonuclease HI